MNYRVANLQGVGARQRQEDSFLFMNVLSAEDIAQKGLFFVVCDGMGGMLDGKVASETAISSFRQSFEQLDYSGDFNAQLKQACITASAEVEKILGGNGGSTAVVCMIYQDCLYFASVGDSFLYLKRGANLIRLNSEHTVCTQVYKECITDGVVNPEEGRANPESVALTSFLGMIGIHEIDGGVRPIALAPGDVLMSSSDGVGAVLSEGQVWNALATYDPNIACQRMEDDIVAINKPNQDNYTALVVQCE